jgi:hypothetical protein
LEDQATLPDVITTKLAPLKVSAREHFKCVGDFVQSTLQQTLAAVEQTDKCFFLGQIES